MRKGKSLINELVTHKRKVIPKQQLRIVSNLKTKTNSETLNRKRGYNYDG